MLMGRGHEPAELRSDEREPNLRLDVRSSSGRSGSPRIARTLLVMVIVEGFLVFGLRARSAHAQSAVDQAEAQIRQGTELRHQNQDARALPYFERAYELSRNPRTAAQLGLVKMALGYCVDAERLLGEALAVPDHPWIERNRETLEGTRVKARQNIGEVAVSGTPAGAEVLINGHSVGSLPLAAPVRLDKGPAEILVRAPGHLPITRSLAITAGAREHLTVALGPASSLPAPPTPTASSPPLAPPSPQSPASSPDVAPSPSAPPLRPLAFTAAGLAAAGLAFGVVETVIASRRIDDFNNHTAPISGDPSHRAPDCETSQLNADCRALRDAHDRARNLAIVGYVGAGVFAATSAVLFVSAQRSASEPARQTDPRLACAPVLPGAGVTCRLAF